MINTHKYYVDDDFTLEVIADDDEEEESVICEVDNQPPEDQQNLPIIEEEKKLTGAEVIIADIKPVSRCPVCKYKSPNEEWLLSHVECHNQVANIKESLREGLLKLPVKCPIPSCRYKAVNEELFLVHLDRHLEIKNKQYKCSSCEFVTDLKNKLSVHKARCNFPHKLYCHYEGCAFVTIRRRSLLQHLQTQHLGIKQYQCSICKCKCNSKDEMKRHKSEMHPKVKTRQCDVCSSTFVTKRELEMHRKKHVRVPKATIFMCDSCDYESRYKSNVVKHHGSRHGVVLSD